MIKIKVGGPQATVELKARKALDGSLLIMDHNKIDIAVMPKQMKVTTVSQTLSCSVSKTEHHFEIITRSGSISCISE